MVLLESMAGVKLIAVHYRGATPALTDVIGGHINMIIDQPSARRCGPSRPARSRCSASAARSACRSCPTCRPSPRRVPGYDAGTWFGLFATAGTPREIVMKINAEVRADHRRAGDSSEQFVKPQLYEPMTSSPEEFAEYIKAETQAGRKVIRERTEDRPTDARHVEDRLAALLALGCLGAGRRRPAPDLSHAGRSPSWCRRRPAA